MNLRADIQRTAPAMETTTDPATEAAAIARRSAPLPEAHHFPKGAKVVLALESDPTIKIQAEVWGGKRRYATIRRKQENSNRFLVGTDVSITLEVQKDV